MVNSFHAKTRTLASLSVRVYVTTSAARATADAAIVAISTTLLMICPARERQTKKRARLKGRRSVDEAIRRLV